MAPRKKLRTFTVRGTAPVRMWCEVEARDEREAIALAEQSDEWTFGDYLEQPTADSAKEGSW